MPSLLGELTATPSIQPTLSPTMVEPTVQPTITPTYELTVAPADAVMATLTVQLTLTPTVEPSLLSTPNLALMDLSSDPTYSVSLSSLVKVLLFAVIGIPLVCLCYGCCRFCKKHRPPVFQNGFCKRSSNSSLKRWPETQVNWEKMKKSRGFRHRSSTRQDFGDIQGLPEEEEKQQHQPLQSPALEKEGMARNQAHSDMIFFVSTSPLSSSRYTPAKIKGMRASGSSVFFPVSPDTQALPPLQQEEMKKKKPLTLQQTSLTHPSPTSPAVLRRGVVRAPPKKHFTN